MSRNTRNLPGTLMLLLAAACSDSPTAPPQVVTSIEIAGGADFVVVGQQVRFDAIVRAADGVVIGGRTISWQVSNPQLLTLVESSDGSSVIASAHSAGTVTITAMVEGKQTQHTLIVRPTPQVPVAAVRFEPQIGVLTIFTGQTHQLRLRAFAADGSELLERAVTYASANETIATVSDAGMVSAQGVGNAIVTAQVEGISTSISIDVRSHIARVLMDPGMLVLGTGENAQVRATLRDASGATLERTITWTSSNEAVATVEADGRITARGPGSAAIKATAEGQEGVTSVQVVEWVQNTLLTVDESALPATLFSRTNGTRVSARAGRFRMIMTGVNVGRYQLYFDATIETSDGGVQYGTLGYNGTWKYNVVSNDFTLTSYSGITMTAKRFADFSMTITGRLEPNTPELTLKFAGN